MLLAALVLPFWISYLMRMLAWVNLFQVDGYFNRLLGWLHLGGSRNWLDGDWSTVVIGLVYGYIPFFILPLYAALERLDKRLIEAGRDLGASPARVFRRITLPLSVPGLMAASVITVLPMFGDYYTNTFLSSGSPRTEMIGNQIERDLRGSSQSQTGASLVLIAVGDVAGADDLLPRRHGASAAIGGDMRRASSGQACLRSGNDHLAVRVVVVGAGAGGHADLVQLRQEPLGISVAVVALVLHRSHSVGVARRHLAAAAAETRSSWRRSAC